MIARRPALGRATALLAAGQGVARAAQLVAVLLLVRALPPAEWAQLALALSFYLFAVGLGSLSLPHSVLYFHPRVGADRQRAFAVQTAGLLAIAGAISAAGVAAAGLATRAGALSIAPLVPWLAAAVALEIPSLATGPWLLAADRPCASALYEAGVAALQTAALALPALLGLGPSGAVRALLACACLRLVVSAAAVIAVTPRGPLRVDWRLVGRQLAYTAPLALHVGAAVLNQSIDKWLVAWLDPAGFGAYAVAAQEIPLVPVIAFAATAALATRLVDGFRLGRPDRVLGYWLAMTARTALIVVPAALAAAMVAPRLIELLFTADYADAILPFQIYTLILLHRVAEYGLVLRAAGDTRSLWWASAVLLVSNLAASAPLTAWLGMPGAALGTLIANAVAWAFMLGRIARVLGTSVRAVLPWSIYLRALALALGAGAIADLLAQRVHAPLAALAVALVALALLYGGGVWALGLTRRLPPVPADGPGGGELSRARPRARTDR